MKRRIVLLGPPASGKGTQAELITAKFGIPSASPGAMLRAEKSAATALGIEADKLTRDGKLVPDELVLQVVRGWLGDREREFVFDGFPRSMGQAVALTGILTERNAPLDVALFLEVDFPTIVRRVEGRLVCSACHANLNVGLHVVGADSCCPRCGGKLVKRADDNLEALELRMREYRAKTEPVLDHYRESGLLASVDSGRTPSEVFGSIVEILEAK